MQGVVVINGFLNGPKFREPAEMMVEAGRRHDVDIRIMYSTDIVSPIGDRDSIADATGDPDFFIFWDKAVKLARDLEDCGYPVFNSSECIRLCDDKALTHLRLRSRGVPFPMTICSPMSFGQPYVEWMPKVLEHLSYPFVAKDCFGSFGEQVRLVMDEQRLLDEGRDGTPKIFQEYIECNGEDIRIEIVGDRAVAAVKRKAPAGDFRANATHGGVMTAYEPEESEIELAIAAAAAVEADFAGVDILSTEDGPVVCEVNSNAHIKNLRNATGKDVSDDILEHIIGRVS